MRPDARAVKAATVTPLKKIKTATTETFGSVGTIEIYCAEPSEETLIPCQI